MHIQLSGFGVAIDHQEVGLVASLFHAVFLDRTAKILNALCFFCGHLRRVPPRHGKATFTALINFMKRVTVCEHCSQTNPVASLHRNQLVTDPPVSPWRVFEVLQNVQPDVYGPLGINPRDAPLEGLMCVNLTVTPNPTRRWIFFSNTRTACDDDFTNNYKRIFKENENLRKHLSQRADILLKPLVRNGPEAQTAYLMLQEALFALQSPKYRSTLSKFSSANSRPQTIVDRIKGDTPKGGQVRQNLDGKRGDSGARSVIGPDPCLAVDQVGVPLHVCRTLTRPERVTPFNIHALTALVRHGPRLHPGANYLHTEDEFISLHVVRPGHINLALGDVVERHLRDDDRVVMNRQPTLTHQSMLAHRVKVQPHQRSLTLHPAVTPTYHADFDGDEMTLYNVKDLLARAELDLMAVHHNMINPSGRMVICFIENNVTAAHLLTRASTFVDREEGQQLLAQHPNPPSPPSWSGGSGRELFSRLLPPDLWVHLPEMNLIIEGGQLRTGPLNKTSLNQGVLKSIFMQQGSRAALAFLDGCGRVLDWFLAEEGFSLGLRDIMVDLDRTVVDRGLAFARAQNVPEHSPNLANNRERNIRLTLSGARDILGDQLLAKMQAIPNNRMLAMVQSKSKGSKVNLFQIGAMIGPQYTAKGQRFSHHTHHAVDRLELQGFNERSFLDGMTVVQQFNHLKEARRGIAYTILDISKPGYAGRRASQKSDVMMTAEGTIVNHAGQLVAFSFGGDNWHREALTRNRLDLHRPARSARQAELVDRVWRELEGRTPLTHVLFPVHFANLRIRWPASPAHPLVADEARAEREWQRLRNKRRLPARLHLLFLQHCTHIPARHRDAWFAHIRERERRARMPAGEYVAIRSIHQCLQGLAQNFLDSFHFSGQDDEMSAMMGTVDIDHIINLSKPRKPIFRVAVTNREALETDLRRREIRAIFFDRTLVTRGQVTTVLHVTVFTATTEWLETALENDWVDARTLFANNVELMEEWFGTDVAFEALLEHFNILGNLMDIPVETRHIRLFAQLTCHRGRLSPMNFKGLKDWPTMLKTVFERSIQSLTFGALKGAHDRVKTVTEAVIWNQDLMGGTGAVTLKPQPHADYTSPANPEFPLFRGVHVRADQLSLDRWLTPPTEPEAKKNNRKRNRKTRPSRAKKRKPNAVPQLVVTPQPSKDPKGNSSPRTTKNKAKSETPPKAKVQFCFVDPGELFRPSSPTRVPEDLSAPLE